MVRKIVKDEMHRKYRMNRRTADWFLSYMYDGMAFIRLNPEE
jgi:hypothetical protein